jgi:hypothetical protein
MAGQLGLQPAFQRGLDQLLNEPLLAAQLQLAGIDLRHQLIQGTGVRGITAR